MCENKYITAGGTYDRIDDYFLNHCMVDLKEEKTAGTSGAMGQSNESVKDISKENVNESNGVNESKGMNETSNEPTNETAKGVNESNEVIVLNKPVNGSADGSNVSIASNDSNKPAFGLSESIQSIQSIQSNQSASESNIKQSDSAKENVVEPSESNGHEKKSNTQPVKELNEFNEPKIEPNELLNEVMNKLNAESNPSPLSSPNPSNSLSNPSNSLPNPPPVLSSNPPNSLPNQMSHSSHSSSSSSSDSSPLPPLLSYICLDQGHLCTLKYCSLCRNFMPPRSYHCRFCGMYPFLSTFLIQLHSKLRSSLSVGVQLRRPPQPQILFMVFGSDFRSISLQVLSEFACVLGVVVMLIVLGRGAYEYVQKIGTGGSEDINVMVEYIVKFWSEIVYLIVSFCFMFLLVSMVSYHLKIVGLRKSADV